MTKWYQNKHHYKDPEKQYVFSYVGTATYGSMNYNTKLVDVKDFKSYWDFLSPKWKGKSYHVIFARPGRVRATRDCSTIIRTSVHRSLANCSARWTLSCFATIGKAPTGSRSAKCRSAFSATSMF